MGREEVTDPTEAEAREQAWREYKRVIIANEYADRVAPEYISARAEDKARAAVEDAIRAEDEQRIVALVTALEEVRGQLWRYLGGRSARARAINVAFDAAFNALRALAGQTEDVSD